MTQKHPKGLDEQVALWFLKQIRDGFSVLRKHGIIHRNLKPGNIVVKEELNLSIGDFKFAKHSVSKESRILGG